MLLVMIFEPQGKSPLSGDLAAVGSILGWSGLQAPLTTWSSSFKRSVMAPPTKHVTNGLV